MGRFLRRIAGHTDVLLAIGIITILSVMIIPLPTYIMDFLLTLNISLALLVLMLTIYITRPLELSVFPGLLLVLTLFRLSLNVASTRLILSNADAFTEASMTKLIESDRKFKVKSFDKEVIAKPNAAKTHRGGKTRI